MVISRLAVAVIATILLLLSAGARAHGDAAHATKKEVHAEMKETGFGRTGDPKSVSRTVKVEMRDTLRFSPAELSIKRGDTVRFVVRNTGKTMHEMVLGSTSELKAHAELMKKFPEMEHDEPYMAHVAPGKTAEMIWQFTKAGEFQYGCLVPGHCEAGMVGKLIVK
jgi:uncharacterized cupredoxin-like copper-binding protein